MLFGAANAAQALDIPAEAECCKFAPGPFTQSMGEIPNFVNPPAGTFHNLTSTALGTDGSPLFASETIIKGTSSPVNGAQYLTAGTYPFYCTLHTGMNGDLIVSGTGTPAARPGLKLTVLNQTLKQVRRTGKIRFKATALGGTPVVAVSLKRGQKAIGSVSVPALAAGASRTVIAKLTNAGRKAMKAGKRVPVSLASAAIPYGSPAKANRVLR